MVESSVVSLSLCLSVSLTQKRFSASPTIILLCVLLFLATPYMFTIAYFTTTTCCTFTFYNSYVQIMTTTRPPLETAGVGRAPTSVFSSSTGYRFKVEYRVHKGPKCTQVPQVAPPDSTHQPQPTSNYHPIILLKRFLFPSAFFALSACAAAQSPSSFRPLPSPSPGPWGRLR